MTAYATVEDLELEMRTTFGDADAAYAAAKLDECSAYLAQLVEIDPTDTTQAANLHYATLSMCSRVMARGNDGDVSSQTIQAGSFSQTVSYSAPYRTVNWWKLLKSSGYAGRLGVAGGIGFSRPSYGRLEADDAQA